MQIQSHLKCPVAAVIAVHVLFGLVISVAQSAKVSSRPLKRSFEGAPGFRERVASEVGLNFVNRLDELEAARNRTLLNGSGLALGDYDGDGLVDIYLCGLNSPNALFRNCGGWCFEDVTDQARVACADVFCRGAVMADVTGDGELDLLVTTVGQGTWLLVNDGDGRFSNQTENSGLASNFGSSTLALADVDGNQTLDLYVSNYRSEDIRDRGRVNLSTHKGRLAIPEPFRNRLILVGNQLHEYGEPDQLFLNDGSGRFRAVEWSSGTFLDEHGKAVGGAFPDWGLTATFRDVNGDRLPDLYVCNDYWSEDRFWINQGKGVFQAIAFTAWRKMSASSMGVDFADLDQDGELDFITVDMLSRDPALRKRQKEAQSPLTTNPPGSMNRPQAMRNALFLAQKGGGYAEVAYYSGIEASDWSWSPIFMDVDMDGLDDVLISAGHARDVQDLDAVREIGSRQHSWEHIKDPARLREAFAREMMEHNRLYPELEMPIVAYRNQGDGRFEEVTDRWGTDALGVRHGMAVADFDGDGDLDLVANRLNGAVSVYENQAAGHRISVRLVGRSGNVQAVGASVSLSLSNGFEQVREVIAGGRYLSGADTEVVFGLPLDVSPKQLTIRWREGGEDVLSDLKNNYHYRVVQDGSVPHSESSPKLKAEKPLFTDVTEALGHRHVDPAFNEYVRQSLLPFERGRAGPAVAFRDLDGDGYDDLAIGGGQGQPTDVFLGDGKGQWRKMKSDSTVLATDSGGVLGWLGPDRIRRLLLSASGYERSVRGVGRVHRLGAQGIETGRPFAMAMQSGGAMALGDVEGNGNMILFLAGGVRPGHYPMGNPSYLYEWKNDQWVVNRKKSSVLSDLGIVNGAVWSDLDGDALPELVLACEWGPIRVFRHLDGHFYEITESLGLDHYTGWWRGVTTVDLNGDGAMDIVATNWGSNTGYQASTDQPLVFYHGELARPNVRDVIETEWDDLRDQQVPTRQLLPLAMSLPFLANTFSSHLEYSEASVETLLGSRQALARQVEVTTLESMIFLNDGGRFRAKLLPREAQWAPASGIGRGDFNGDGYEDIALAQNFFPTRPGVDRHDSGRGLILLGNGEGELRPLSETESGFIAWGDQRALAVGDYDGDGRSDLVLTQNGAETRIFHNTGAASGLRVHLVGPPGNPSGVGALIRLAHGVNVGPAREILSGSGYLSQDSRVTILHGPLDGASVWVQWPGGQVSNVAVPRNAAELTVRFAP